MRTLVWYWGRRGGGAHFAFGLAGGMAPETLALSLSRQNEMLPMFRSLPVARQEVDTFRGWVGLLAGAGRLPALAARLCRFVAEQRVSVVLSAMSHPWTPFLAPVLARAGVAFVPVVHDARPHPGDPTLLFGWRLQRELRAARAAIVLSEAVARGIAARRPGLPLIRLPLGALLPPGAPIRQKRADFLFFGRVRRYKGLDLLRDAWPLLRATHPGATLRVVGEGDVEACAPGLARLPGVAVERRWVPEAELAPLLGSAGALVLPYREASQSGVLPLALARGVPVLATTVGGLSEQVRDGDAGLLAPPEPEALAAAMRRMLDPALRERLARGAAAAAEPLVDWRAQAAALQSGLAAALAK